MGKGENKKVFQHTESICGSNKRLVESIASSIEAQVVILEKEDFKRPDLKKYDDKARVIVSKKRTFEAASKYISDGNHVAVHNFASASNPGGGVVNGASAQEECLCRCSGLYLCLSIDKMRNEFYTPHKKAHDPIHNDDIIYTPGVTEFKTVNTIPHLMPESNRYDVDVITCAAPNRRERPSNK